MDIRCIEMKTLELAERDGWPITCNFFLFSFTAPLKNAVDLLYRISISLIYFVSKILTKERLHVILHPSGPIADRCRMARRSWNSSQYNLNVCQSRRAGLKKNTRDVYLRGNPGKWEISRHFFQFPLRGVSCLGGCQVY